MLAQTPRVQENASLLCYVIARCQNAVFKSIVSFCFGIKNIFPLSKTRFAFIRKIYLCPSKKNNPSECQCEE